MNEPDVNLEAVPVRLIRAALCAHWSAEAQAQASALAVGTDWPAVMALAESERVGPLIHRWARGEANIPPTARERLREMYLETALENALRMHEVGALLDAFSAAGLSVVVLKGIALAESIYDNIALRPMVDMDMLVRHEDAVAALNIARAQGYQSIQAEVMPGLALAYENEIGLRKDGRFDWSLEIHWGVFNSPFYQANLSESALWAEVREVLVDRHTTLTLRPEAQFLHLAGHLMLHHRGVGLLWWADLGELLHRHRQDFEWEKLLALATEWRLVAPLRDIVPVLAGLWLVPVPAPTLDRLAAMPVTIEETRIYAALTASSRPVARRLWDDLWAMKGGERLAFLFANLFPSAAYMDQRYIIRHPYLRPLYYPYRWAIGLFSALSHSNPSHPSTPSVADQSE